MKIGAVTAVALTVCFFSAKADAADASAPVVCIRKCASAPDLKAGPEAREFQAASRLTGFTDISTKSLATGRTEAALTFDEENLCIAFKCFSPVPPKATVKERDGQVWDDDAVEVFLDPTNSRSEYYQLIGNAAGAVWDSRGRDGSWNAKWDYAARIEKGCWTATFRIPFAALGVKAPADGAAWGINLCRDQQTPVKEISSWAVTDEGFHHPERFGRLVFDRNGAAIYIRSAGMEQGNTIRFNASVLAGQSLVRLTVGLLNPETKKYDSFNDMKVEPHMAVEAAVGRRIAAPGAYQLVWEVTDLKTNGVVGRGEVPFKVLAPLAVSLRKYFLNGLLGVDVTAAGIEPAAGISVRIEICKLQDKSPLLTATIPQLDAHRKGSVEIRVGTPGSGKPEPGELPPGEYSVTARALDPAGKQVAQTSAAFSIPKRPDWLGSSAGVTRGVLPPWTPLEIAGSKVKCYGRVYDFKDGFLPAEVVTAGESVLAAPIELRAVVNGKAREWNGVIRKVKASTHARVDFDLDVSADDLSLSGKSYVEYDGMIWVDLVVNPKRKVTLDSLTLEMPMKESAATLMHYFPGRWGKATNSGAIPEAGWASPFRPFVWIGMEERGLAWFMETDEQFVVKDKAKAVEIVRERGGAAQKPDPLGALLGKKPANVVRLKIHLIDGPFEVSAPRRYAFGFQASPVKPWPKDFHEWRICHGASYGMDKRPATRFVSVSYPADGNIQIAQGTFEAWVTPMFDPDVKIENPSARGAFNQSLFTARFRNEEAGFYWNIDDRGMRFYAKVGDRHPLVFGTHSRWKQGEPHHVAFTWGSELMIHIDGKLAGSKPFEGLLGGASPKPADGIITLGGQGAFLVDEFRISDCVRAKFDLNTPPAADAHALLVEHFDDPVTERFGGQTKPAKAAGTVGGMVIRGGQWVDTKFGKGLVLGGKIEGGPSALDLAKELGVKTLIYHESWTDIQNYRMAGHEEEMRHLVAECHKRGIRLLVYFGYEIANIAPEWEIYGRDVGRLNPDAPLPTKGGYHRSPEQHDFGVCYSSWWQDFLCDAIERTMKDYDLDGVYLDGTIEPMACANYRHGCGYKRADGGYAATYPILAVRNTMKRIYAICTAKPGGHVNAHQSTCCTTPTLAFTTSYWDGEQLGSVPHVADPSTVLPLDTFRAEFMGRNFGVPCELLNYAPKPYTLDEALSFSMLHDVLVRPGGVGATLEQMSEIWRVLSDFGADEAEFLPYWRNADVAKTSSTAIRTSIYRRPDKGLLMVISNLGQADDPAASVQLDLKKLGLDGRVLQAEDTLAGQKVVIADGKVALPVDKLRMRLVWVK